MVNMAVLIVSIIIVEMYKDQDLFFLCLQKTFTHCSCSLYSNDVCMQLTCKSAVNTFFHEKNKMFVDFLRKICVLRH